MITKYTATKSKKFVWEEARKGLLYGLEII